ncbi:MAG: hypothetical protein SFX73_02805 [Kofleriaceae bacterium]|nr:hypothetical protein [Kofleriaceae bacterium]
MRSLLLSSTVLLVACGGDLELSTPSQCNPLGGAKCATPWPSSVYEIDDASTPTGKKLAIVPGALPTNVDGIAVDPAVYNRQDGYSPAAPILVVFDTGVDDSNLVHFKELAKSLTADSPTVLLDMTTGELVEHFAELDTPAADTPASQALFIRSSKMLAAGHRYAVAIKKTLKAKGGGELPISEGFQAILDGETTTHLLLEKVRGHYPEIFSALEAKGVAKTDLVVAWDFTTRSKEDRQFDLLHARTATLAAAGTNGANLDFTVDSDTTPGDTRYVREIKGTFDVPNLLVCGNNNPGCLSGNNVSIPGTRLNRDADGKPVADGFYRAPFTALVPQCALTAQAPVPVIIYGHGLLGTGAQAGSSGPRHIGAALCAIVIGTDMRGMASPDVPNVVLALNDGNNGHAVFETLVQGMMNHIALVQIARGPMATELFIKDGGGTLVDPNQIFWYGISQGGIMGTTVCAIDPVIKRCVLQVGAINYSLLLERSLDWPQYHTTLIGAYPDAFDATFMINLLQNWWDRTEPTAVADVITDGGFPDTPPKQVFMQMAIADDEVSNLGTEYQARTMKDIKVLTPSPYVPQGLEGTAGPVQSGLVIYDFGLGGTIPDTNVAPPENSVHGGIRNKTLTVDMMKRFYETGEIVQMCTAPKGCDCANNGCGTDL